VKVFALSQIVFNWFCQAHYVVVYRLLMSGDITGWSKENINDNTEKRRQIACIPHNGYFQIYVEMAL